MTSPHSTPYSIPLTGPASCGVEQRATQARAMRRPNRRRAIPLPHTRPTPTLWAASQPRPLCQSKRSAFLSEQHAGSPHLCRLREGRGFVGYAGVALALRPSHEGHRRVHCRSSLYHATPSTTWPPASAAAHRSDLPHVVGAWPCRHQRWFGIR